MKLVTLVNRTTRTLEGKWDGKPEEIAPGKHSYPELQAVKYKEQNPIMGSFDPRTGYGEYLIGIEEFKDDCSPIEQSNEIELLKREDKSEVKVVKGKAGVWRGEGRAALPLEGKFSDPG